MYNEEVLKRVAACGGFFTMKILPQFCVNSLTKYINRKNNVEMISTGRRNNIGYIYKIPDTDLSRYHEPDSRKKYRILTIKGSGEFFKRTKEYVEKNCRNKMMSDHYNKEWYKNIYAEVLKDPEFSNYARYTASDYKLFVCFTRILATFEQGVSIIPKKEEAEFCKEHGLLGHRDVSNGITFGYSYSREKVIILVSDFMKSEKSLINILEYYNRNEFEILIYSFRPAEIFEEKMRSKFFKEWGTVPNMTVINNPYLNRFFGEY